MVLLAAASTPIAMLVYSAALTQTSQYTLQTKAGLINGSRTAVQSVDPIHRSPTTDAVGTIVYRYLYGKVDGQTTDVTVLAIDPDTFPATAYWDRRYADQPLDTLHDPAQSPDRGRAGTGGRRSSRTAGLRGRRSRSGWASTRIQVRDRRARAATSRAAAIPRADARRGPVPARRRWTSSPGSSTSCGAAARRRPAPRRAVSAQQARIYLVTSQDTVFDVANFLGVSWTFGYLSALAALVGLVAIGGLLLYLETRQRSRTASYALGRRMGLTRATHLRSLLAELGVLLGLAWTIGAGLAWTAVLIVYERLDIDPTRPPAPLLTVPVLAFAGSAVAVAVVVVLAALYAQRSADRADVSEVLRLGS